MRKLIYQHPNCTMEYDDSIPYVFMLLKGFIPPDVYREISTERLKILEKYNTKYIITDARELKVLNKESLEYNKDIYIPTLERIGIKKSYMVVSEDVFTNYMVTNIDKRLKFENSVIEVGVFRTLEKALGELQKKLKQEAENGD